MKEAHAALAQAKKLQPGLSLDWAIKYAPYVKQADLQRYVDGLRKAGLS